MRIEVAVGRRRTWYGQRMPGQARARPARRARTVRPRRRRQSRSWPTRCASFTARALEATRAGDHPPDERARPLGRRLSVATMARGETIAQAALRLAEQASDRLLERAVRRIRDARRRAPRVDHRRATPSAIASLPLISVSGTNGKSTTTRMITHIAATGGRHVGTTTTDGVLIDEQMVEPGDFTRAAGGASRLRPARRRRWRARNGARRHPAARPGLRVERRQRADQRQRRSPRPPGAAHAARAGRGQVGHLPRHATGRHGRAQRRRSAARADRAARVARRCRSSASTPRSSRMRAHVARGGRAFVLDDGWLVELRRAEAAADRRRGRAAGHARRPGAPQRRQRARRRRRRAGTRHVLPRRSQTGCATSATRPT